MNQETTPENGRSSVPLDKIVICKHHNYVPAGYPNGDCAKQNVDFDKCCVLRASSLYDVYCTDCNNFVNLLSKEIINDKGLVRYR